VVERGPDPDRDGVVRWRRVDLQVLIGARLGGRAARALGRQGPAPARLRPAVGPPEAPEGRGGGAGRLPASFPKLAKAAPPEEAAGKPVEVWFQDEARVGQQGTPTRIWARRGGRPRAPRDRRYAWAYLFGAVCPARSARRGLPGAGHRRGPPARATGAGLVLPHVNAEATGLHLAEVGRHVTPGAHAVVVLDGAGWHAAADLAVPGNVTLLPLPPYSPEPNPVENVGEHLRQDKLSLMTVRPDYEAIVAGCCEAWNALMAAPERVGSITRRGWAEAVSD
jgi:hypothetical protein